MTVARTDPDGAPRAGTGTWRLVAIAEPAEDASAVRGARATRSSTTIITTPGDRLRPRWDRTDAAAAVLHGWPDGPERAQGTLVHDAKGEARLELPALPAGAWRIHYETRDDFGDVRRVDQDFLVAGKRMPVKLPGVVRVERETVAAGRDREGSRASRACRDRPFFSRLSAPAASSRSRTLAGDDDSLIEMPVGEQDRGGFEVRLSLVSDHQLVTRQRPHSGSVERQGARRSRSRRFATGSAPGAKETWRVTVKAPSGAPVGDGCRGTARLHVRPEPRRVRRALSAQSARRSTRTAPRAATSARASVRPAALWVFGSDFGLRPLAGARCTAIG